MCGIYGILSKETNVNIIQFILDGLVQLQIEATIPLGFIVQTKTTKIYLKSMHPRIRLMR